MTEEKKSAGVNARIAKAMERDAGRGYARIDPELERQLGLKPGDVIEIENPQKNSNYMCASYAWVC